MSAAIVILIYILSGVITKYWYVPNLTFGENGVATRLPLRTFFVIVGFVKDISYLVSNMTFNHFVFTAK